MTSSPTHHCWIGCGCITLAQPGRFKSPFEHEETAPPVWGVITLQTTIDPRFYELYPVRVECGNWDLSVREERYFTPHVNHDMVMGELMKKLFWFLLDE